MEAVDVRWTNVDNVDVLWRRGGQNVDVTGQNVDVWWTNCG